MEEVSENVVDESNDTSASAEPEKTSAKNKRVFDRYRVKLKVLIRLSDGDIATAEAVDLSNGGIYVEYGAAADVDAEFDIAFDLPFTADFKRVMVKARVNRCIVLANRNMFGLAFEFVAFSKQTDKHLEKYLELRKLKTN